MLERRRPESCLSDSVLDRVVVGELPPPEHLRGCAGCAARLDELRAPALMPPMRQSAARQSAAPPSTARGRWPILGGLLLAAAALLLVVWVRPPPLVRVKGGFAIDLYARRADGRVERLLPNAELHPGEMLRFRVSSDGDGWLAVLGLDARPSVTAYSPPARFHAAHDQLLDGAIELDATLGPERIVAALCPRAVTADELVEAARRALTRAGGDPARVGDLGLDCRQSSFVITKTK